MIRTKRRHAFFCLFLLFVVFCGVCSRAQVQDFPVSIASTPAQKFLLWQRMTPSQQADLRVRYRAWLALSLSEHARLLKAHSEIASLSPMQQQTLHARFARLDKMYSRGWFLGPRLGAYYVHLQPLIGYVPEAERAPLLVLLHDLDDTQLAQLAVLVHRTPPAQCAVLRRELLGHLPTQRGEWLRTRLRQ
ncbi:MAG TPA: DUF3106 domain-containing protein [Xylella sp.]